MKKRNRKRKLTRSQKGISLIALTTTILVLAIVTSIVVYNSKNNIMIKQYKKLENDIDVLNNKVGMYYLKNGELPICMRSDRTYIEYNDNRTEEEQKYNKFKEDKHQNDNDKYFILDLNKIDGISLNYGADFYNIDQAYTNLGYCPDLYVINQQSHRIYYVKGIDMGIERAADGSLSNGKVYYTVGENVEIPLYKSIKYIKDLTDLKEVRKNVNEGSQTYKDWILIQTQNIKMNGEEWNEPIGTDAHPFEGEYNGAGYAIENFKINSTVSGGIFGVNKGTIQNLGIESGKIVANGISGAIVSKNAGGSIINCYNKADAVYNITNIEFISGKVEDNIEKFKKIDTIIVDPPRVGVSKKVINNILNINPKKLIYVSCNSSTLARDLKLLENNYEIKSIKLFDMFPNTYHVACVCILKLK